MKMQFVRVLLMTSYGLLGAFFLTISVAGGLDWSRGRALFFPNTTIALFSCFLTSFVVIFLARLFFKTYKLFKEHDFEQLKAQPKKILLEWSDKSGHHLLTCDAYFKNKRATMFKRPYHTLTHINYLEESGLLLFQVQNGFSANKKRSVEFKLNVPTSLRSKVSDAVIQICHRNNLAIPPQLHDNKNPLHPQHPKAALMTLAQLQELVIKQQSVIEDMKSRLSRLETPLTQRPPLNSRSTSSPL